MEARQPQSNRQDNIFRNRAQKHKECVSRNSSAAPLSHPWVENSPQNVLSTGDYQQELSKLRIAIRVLPTNVVTPTAD